MAGRKRKPTALHRLEGTNPRRTPRDAEPQPVAGTPDPPAGLREPVVAAYAELAGRCAAGVLTSSDANVLELAAELLVETRELGVLVLDMGEDRSTADGNRLVSQRRQAQRLLATAMASLGLTPVDRSKVSVVSAPAETPGEARLRKRGVA